MNRIFRILSLVLAAMLVALPALAAEPLAIEDGTVSAAAVELIREDGTRSVINGAADELPTMVKVVTAFALSADTGFDDVTVTVPLETLEVEGAQYALAGLVIAGAVLWVHTPMTVDGDSLTLTFPAIEGFDDKTIEEAFVLLLK